MADSLTRVLAAAENRFGMDGGTFGKEYFECLARAACEYLVEKLDESKTRQVEEYNYHDSNTFWMGKLAGMDTAARIIQREMP